MRVDREPRRHRLRRLPLLEQRRRARPPVEDMSGAAPAQDVEVVSGRSRPACGSPRHSDASTAAAPRNASSPARNSARRSGVGCHSVGNSNTKGPVCPRKRLLVRRQHLLAKGPGVEISGIRPHRLARTVARQLGKTRHRDLLPHLRDDGKPRRAAGRVPGELRFVRRTVERKVELDRAERRDARRTRADSRP